jgi:N-sulfoglucosamine sulfohydrolase
MKSTVILPVLFSIGLAGCTNDPDLPPPNILWVSCEDITTLLACYGDPNASTPHLDAFAKQSVLFSNAFATAPACAPSRSGIITGVNAVKMGTQRLRSEITIPGHIVPFPKFLREAGYYASNNSKEDYNFTDNTIWDNSSSSAHWRLREGDQSFFSVFNIQKTHQSQIFGSDSVYDARIKRYLPHINPANPETLVLPPYYPDTPEIRKLWARYYTNVSIVDYEFSLIISELEADGLADSTIVIFFSDHGTGVPRGKRSLYDSGMKIPLLVRVPEAYAKQYGMYPATIDERMINFIDFAPTMLAIAGIKAPSAWHGKAFIPVNKKDQHEYVFGTSDRVDEGFEVARSIRTPKYLYIRNFLPHLPLIQPNFYTDQSEIMQELFRVNRETQLSGPEMIMFNPRRLAEELYDVESDPHQIHNLIKDEQYKGLVDEMRIDLKNEMKRVFDTGLMPEPEMIRLSEGSTPYEIAHKAEIFRSTRFYRPAI